jgi:hypothetical protein
MPASATVERSTAGHEPAQLAAGHVLLTHGRHWPARIIRFGQRLRFTGRRAPFAYWNHVALVLNADGDLAEALGRGVVRTNIEKYRDTTYELVRIDCSDEDREQIAAFAQAVLAARWRYGWWTIVALALTLLTGSRFVFGRVGTAICSGFAAEALVRAGLIFARPPAFMLPADLAEHFGAQGPVQLPA